MNVIHQFLGGLADLVPPPPRSPSVSSGPKTGMVFKRSASISAPLVRGQMLMPVTAWNWPDPVTGTMADAQFLFADTVPQSAANGALYQASGRSFSQGYKTFLQVLEACKFPYQSMLAGAMQKMATPAGEPAYSPTPVGWTKVYETGYLQWKPIWTLPKSSSGVERSSGCRHDRKPRHLALESQRHIRRRAAGSGFPAGPGRFRPRPCATRRFAGDGHDHL